MAGANIDFGLEVADPQTWIPAIFNVGTKALGTGTPEEQVVASVAIMAVAISASVVSLGATLLVVLVTFPFFVLGLVRLALARWGA